MSQFKRYILVTTFGVFNLSLVGLKLKKLSLVRLFSGFSYYIYMYIIRMSGNSNMPDHTFFMYQFVFVCICNN